MLNQIFSRVRGRTPAEILSLGAATVRHTVRHHGPAMRAARRRDAEFDRRWGTDTSAIVRVRDLGFDAARTRQAVQYEPSSPDMLVAPLATMGIDPAAFDFIDYGSGKGRMLMLAMTLGFRRVTGIELSPALCDVARANIARFAAQHPCAPRAETLCVDATRHAPRGERILAYLYNPFGDAVLAPVRDQLEEALAADTREVRVIYANPRHLAVFEASGAWRVERADADCAILRAG